MIRNFDHETLWVKAKLFLNRAMEDELRSFDEKALWAALALELLAKAALARESPVLIAEPKEDGINLLMATGLVKGDARFTSVRAKTLMGRCSKAFKPFNQSEAMRIINGRNEYLHSGGTGFTGVPPQVWWQRYWAQADILVTALDRDVEELVGSDRAQIIMEHLEQNTKNIEHRTQALIERAKQRFEQRRRGNLPARMAADWKSASHLSAGLIYSDDETCPACGSGGLIEGDEVLNTEIHYLGDDRGHEEYNSILDASVALTIGADHFSCPTCQLVLKSYDLIVQAGLPGEFEADGDLDDLAQEPDYGND